MSPAENDSIKSIDELIQDKIKNGKRFFGIEIMPSSRGEVLNFTKFTAQPLFTAITWRRDSNLKSENLSDGPAIRLGKTIEKSSPVLMHLTCYKLQVPKVRELLDLGFKNILAIQGGE